MPVNTSSSMRATNVPVRASLRARLKRRSAIAPSNSTGAMPKSVNQSTRTVALNPTEITAATGKLTADASPIAVARKT